MFILLSKVERILQNIYILRFFETESWKVKANLLALKMTLWKVQGRKWQVGRVGNCPPSFWQNRRRRRAVVRQHRRTTLLLAHPVLGSHLYPCRIDSAQMG